MCHVLIQEALQQVAAGGGVASRLPPHPHPSVADWRVNQNVLPLVLTLLNFGLCHGCFTVLCIFYNYLTKLKRMCCPKPADEA